MEDTIKAFKKKPFRGVTTIQLFDKDTGELVKEVVHENTYNQRLMYFTYFDEILQTGGRFMSANSPSLGSGWIGPAVNYGGVPRCYQNWYNTKCTDGSSNTGYLNMYATLFLTNHTGDASAQGYPDGIPVALAPLAGVSSYASSHVGMGTINIQESYKGNDRIHFVVDFDTSHGNCTFDSLWIYPSNSEQGQSDNTTKCASVCSFYNRRHLRSLALETSIVNSASSNGMFYSWEINYPYIVVAAFSSSFTASARDWRNLHTLYVYNSETDAIISQCSVIETNKSSWFPTYYDVSTNTLKGWCNASRSDFYCSWACPNPVQNIYPININMEAGTMSRDTATSSSIPLKVNMTLEELGVNSVADTYVGLYYLQNTAYLILSNGCRDENNNTVYRLAIYLANLNANTFTKVAIHSFIPIRAGSANILNHTIMRDNLMFIPYVVLSSGTETNRGIVIDITNGNIIEQNWDTYNISSMAYSQFTFADIPTNLYSLFGYLSNKLTAYYGNNIMRDEDATMYKFFNQKKTKHFRYFSLDTGRAQAYEVDYATAIWSTHNHLDEPITKTNQTTMKIQYDIIWDSITDVIVPAIL